MLDKGLISIDAMARTCHRISNLFLQAQGAGLEEVCSFFLGRWAQVFSSQAWCAWEEGQAHHAASPQARAAILAARKAASQLWELA